MNKDVELAIDLAARDVAKAFADIYGDPDAAVEIKRLITGYASMAVSKAAMEADKKSWTGEATAAWLVTADPQTSLDQDALVRAIGRWWDGLDATKQLSVIMGPAGHHKSEYISNLEQKYRDKPESVLEKDLPELAALYKAEANPGTAQQ